MTAPTWTILIPTIPERAPLFARLMDALLPQLEPYAGRARVLARRNVGAIPLGELRDLMLRATDAEYVCFVDDDDMVPDYYVAEIMNALDSRPDHVGFRMDYTTDAEGRIGHEIVDHSLTWGKWGRSASGQLYRDLTHVDPIRRDIALRGSFGLARRGRAEDRVWCKQIRPFFAGGFSEVYIDKIMYYYQWSEAGSSWARDRLILPVEGPLPMLASPHAAWDPASV
jgi:hypothetical protein